MNNSEVEKPFVMRCKKDFTKAVEKFAASELNEDVLSFYPDDRAVSMLRTYHAIVNRTMVIRLRAIKILLADGSTEILLTNLFDKKSFSNKQLAQLYRMRWMIETDIGKEKNLFQLENFSSHTRNSIEQDFYATFIAANIHHLIARQANKAVQQKIKNRKYQYQINTSASLAVFKKNLAKLYYTKKLKALLLHLQNVFEEFIEPIRPGRKVVRIKRTRRRYGKHQTQINYRNNL